MQGDAAECGLRSQVRTRNVRAAVDLLVTSGELRSGRMDESTVNAAMVSTATNARGSQQAAADYAASSTSSQSPSPSWFGPGGVNCCVPEFGKGDPSMVVNVPLVGS